jgi:hypothetical protein
MGRSGQPVQNPAGRIGKRPVEKRRRLENARRVALQERLGAALEHLAGVFARARQHLLTDDPGLELRLMQDHVEVLFDVLRLALLHDQHRGLAAAEAHDLRVDERIGDIEHVERQLRVAGGVGQTEQLQRAQ